jgi:hypothetical protein
MYSLPSLCIRSCLVCCPVATKTPLRGSCTSEGCAFLENRIRYVYNFTIDAVLGTPGLSSCLGTVPESPISLILTLWHKQ